MSKDVLVIGGGIAGIQASLDLAEKGIHVYLVEREPSIGGRMAQLDKTFPTMDCSICILAPKMSDCYQNEQIEVITYAEVEKVVSKANGFSVTILKRARYVDEQKCTGCGECALACRLSGRIPNEFEMGLGKRGAIYVPFLQAVPRIMTVDKENCLYLKKGKCGKEPSCRLACQSGAIDFGQKDEKVEIDVGAIVVATGFDVYEPDEMFEYGYGKYANVYTAMEYERLVCASGPTGGELLTSQGKHPSSIAFIQCVGSRDFLHSKYCSSVCCMFATKEAVLAKEHYGDIHAYIFYTDMKAVGKGFEEFISRAKQEYGIDYIRARVGFISEDKKTKQLTIWYEDGKRGKATRLTVDLVVLATALLPRSELAKILHIETDESGFIRAKDEVSAPVQTSQERVFVAGYCQSPKDIPESVAQGSAAAAKVAEVIA